MEKSIADIEKGIERLQKSLDETLKFKNKLELSRSNLLHFMKMAEQNLKYLKNKNTISLIGEYQKVTKSHQHAVRQTEELEKQIKSIGNSIEKLSKNLKDQLEFLDNLKKNSGPKVLPFKRKNT